MSLTKKILLLLVLCLSIQNFAAAQTAVLQQDQTGIIKVDPASVAISTVKSKYDAIDPGYDNVLGRSYPGMRGSNQLIIYTSKYGLRTGTNEFGKEAVVVDGTVTALTGSNSLIPLNGFVISGHGTAKNWISKNIIIGAKVQIDYPSKTVKVFVTPESYTYSARQKIEEVKAMICYFKNQCASYTYSTAQKYLDKSYKYLHYADVNLYTNKDKAIKYSDYASTYADMALEHAIPYYPDELKGVWIRPTEHTPEQIESTIDKIKDAGITDIFLETYYHGSTIYPSSVMRKNKFREQKDEYKGFDPLKVWVDKAHANNIKVHVWFQTFYTGNTSLSDPNSILSVRPDWANVQKRNSDAKSPMPSVSEHNGYFLDPANKNVQKFLLSLLNEVTSKYKVDGINVDYIRYPASLSKGFTNFEDSTWGYSKVAREEFLSIYGKDPVELTKDEPLWTKWEEYRQQKVTEFVSSLRSTVDSKNITISTVIFPNIVTAKETKLQNWQEWSQKDYIDAFTPLVLGSDDESALNDLSEIHSLSSYKTKVYAGLFVPFTNGEPADMLRQIKAARMSNANGVILFDYAHLDENYSEPLKSRVFNSKY